jgi:regulator of RNase E activity RraA
MSAMPLAPVHLEELRRFSTCLVASAIEPFKFRLPNTGFSDSSIRCIFEDLPPIVGYAATLRVRTAEPPMEGGSFSYDCTAWWNQILTMPAPRVVVIQDVDHHPGVGAFVGEVHANILQALGCVGVVTNGAVRDLDALQNSGFQMFAGGTSVSHAYAHVFDFGGPVDVAQLTVQPGDLLHADRHGVLSIPLEIADQIPSMAAAIEERRRRIVNVCRSPKFSIENLRASMQREIHEH